MSEKSRKPKAKGASLAGQASQAAANSPSPSQTDAKSDRAVGEVASRLIDERIESLGDWRGQTLAAVRRLIHEAAPDILEEWKWKGTPVWSHSGNVCTGEVYKQVVKLTFPKGASLPDPQSLFNSSLEGNTRRAIDIRDGETLEPTAFRTLIQAAIAENLRSKTSQSKSPAKSRTAAKEDSEKSESSERANSKKVVLLSGGNPQIAKADGDAPVQAYIAAMPGWKSSLGKRLDELIMQTVPNVRKAVRWNSPFYGMEGQGWFLSFHVLTRYVKVTFFNGLSLQPLPPGGTPKSQQGRWIDIYEDDDLDEAQMARWIQQASELPGWIP